MSVRRAVKSEQINGGDLFQAKPALKLSSLDEIKYLELRVVQHFGNFKVPIYAKRKKRTKENIIGYTSMTPFCDMEACGMRAVVMLATPENKGWCLCMAHRNELGNIK